MKQYLISFNESDGWIGTRPAYVAAKTQSVNPRGGVLQSPLVGALWLQDNDCHMWNGSRQEVDNSNPSFWLAIFICQRALCLFVCWECKPVKNPQRTAIWRSTVSSVDTVVVVDLRNGTDGKI